MSGNGDETGLAPKRSEDNSLLNPITEGLVSLNLSESSSTLPVLQDPSLPESISRSTVKPALPSPEDDPLMWCEKAVQDYDNDILLSPNDVKLRIDRAEALVELGQLEAAFDGFREAQKLEPNNCEIHYRMYLLNLSIGNFVLAEEHMKQSYPEHQESLSAQIKKVKEHLLNAEHARKDGDWEHTLREAEAAITEGADISPLAITLRAEMHLRMDQLDQAENLISRAVKLEQEIPFILEFNGMQLEAYICAVLAQIKMALGKFKSALTEAEKAYEIDKSNDEIIAIRKNVEMASEAYNKGSEHYKKGEYSQAYDEYKAGLQYSKSNVSLLSCMAACHLHLERWKQCIEICTNVLRIKPDHRKALEGRAYSYSKLKKWVYSAIDYHAATKLDPENTKLANALLNAQKKKNEWVSCMEDGIQPVMIMIATAEEFKEAMSISETSIVFFQYDTDPQCIEITPSVDKLCAFYYPRVYFFMVDLIECSAISITEGIYGVPSLAIYKKGGQRMKEMIECRPSIQVEELIEWVENYFTESQTEGK